MSAAAPTRLPHSQRLPEFARIIPGAHTESTARRKKAAFVTIGGVLSASDKTAFESTKPQFAAERILHTLLPKALLQNGRAYFSSAVCADLVSSGLGFAAAVNLSNFGELFPGGRSAPGGATLPVPGLMLLQASALTLLGYSEHLYDRQLPRHGREQWLTIVKVAAWAAVLTIIVTHCFGIFALSTVTLADAAGFSLLFMIGWRGVAQKTESVVADRNILIVGAGSLSRKLADHLEKNHGTARVTKQFLDVDWTRTYDTSWAENFFRLARRNFLDEVVIALPSQHDLTRALIGAARRNHLDVKVVPDFFGIPPGALELETVEAAPLLTLRRKYVPVCSLAVKRLIDVAFAAIVLVLTAPLMAAAALVIKLGSTGPVLYRSERAGRKGRHFICYKLRTMVADAENLKASLRTRNQRQGAFFKIADDPRITHAGRWLRRYSVDELPQLWNVLKGEMSLVGPRPHPLDDCEKYDLEDWRRLSMTPGLTGLWQVTARRDPSFERSMKLDLEYILQWSLWLDFLILCRTLPVVLRGSGA